MENQKSKTKKENFNSKVNNVLKEAGFNKQDINEILEIQNYILFFNVILLDKLFNKKMELANKENGKSKKK